MSTDFSVRVKVHSRLQGLLAYKLHYRVLLKQLTQFTGADIVERAHKSARVRQVVLLRLLVKDVLRMALDVDIGGKV